MESQVFSHNSVWWTTCDTNLYEYADVITEGTCMWWVSDSDDQRNNKNNSSWVIHE